MDVTALAQALSDSFEEDAWGDIDPWLFKVLANKEKYAEDLQDPELEHNVNALATVLQRVSDVMKG